MERAIAPRNNVPKALSRPWWMKLTLWALFPWLASIGALYMSHYASEDGILVLFLKEAHHFLTVVGWVGVGITMATHALHELAEEAAESAVEDVSTTIRAGGRRFLEEVREKMVPEFGSAVSGAIRDLGGVLAECIAGKEFFNQDLLNRISNQIEPQPLLGADPECSATIRSAP